MNTNGDYYETIYKVFIDYLAVDFFLNRNEEPPMETDLLKHIYDNSLEREFIDYLILKIHELVFIENFNDEIKTAFRLHMQKNIDKK